MEKDWGYFRFGRSQLLLKEQPSEKLPSLRNNAQWWSSYLEYSHGSVRSEQN